MRKNKIKLLIASILCLLILSGIFLTFVFIFCMVESASVKKLGEKIIKMQAKNVMLQKLKKTHNEWMNINSTYKDIKEDFFFAYEDFSKIRRDLSQVIQSSFLKVLKEDYKITNIRNEFAKVTSSLIFEGTYMKVKKFIFQIQTKKKMIVFKSILLKKKGSICYGEIVMEVYFVR